MITVLEAPAAWDIEHQSQIEFEGDGRRGRNNLEGRSIEDSLAGDSREFISTAGWIIGAEIATGIELKSDLDIALAGQRTKVDASLTPSLVIESRGGYEATSEGILVSVSRNVVFAIGREGYTFGVGLVDVTC